MSGRIYHFGITNVQDLSAGRYFGGGFYAEGSSWLTWGEGMAGADARRPFDTTLLVHHRDVSRPIEELAAELRTMLLPGEALAPEAVESDANEWSEGQKTTRV